MRGTFGVLLVEGNPDDADLIRAWLGDTPTSSFRLRQVSTLAGALEALAFGGVDAIVLDWVLPDSRGVASLDSLSGGAAGCPIIVVMSTVTEELRADAIDHGAEDVFDKADAASRLFSRAVLYVIERNHARARQRQIERLHDSAPDGVLIVDHDGVVRYVNRAARALFARSRDTLVGEPLGFSVKDGEPSEIVVVRSDGPRTCELRVVPFEWDGRPGHLATLRDLTDLVESERRFERLSSSGVLGIVTVDLEHRTFVEANDAFLAMVGYSRGEVAETGWGPLVAPHEQGRVEAVLAALRSTGLAPPFEMDLLRRDGTRARALIGSAVLTGGRCVSFLIDITARRRAEEARQRAEESLRAAETQLRLAQKMEAVGRLAGGVAHDFNNILSVVLSYADSAFAGATDAVTRAEIDEVRTAAERAAALTRQLLTFSRQEVVEARVIDPGRVLHGMTSLLGRLVREDAALFVRVSPDLGRVYVDPGRLEQVVMNLVVNARDAVIGKVGRITLDADDVSLEEGFTRERPGLAIGPHVRIAVRDDGAGMDEDTLSRVFEPFFTTKPPGRGTGLGLATVFGIVQQAGGHIDVESALGKGTTFTLYLPIVEAPLDEDAHVAPVVVDLRGTETILLVEDDDKVREVAAAILRRHGYHVLDARDAADAVTVSHAHAGRIHLLVSDIVMAGMSGAELARRLGGDRVERVLCMSGHTREGIVQRGILGADIPFLQKPFTSDTLARRVREVLDDKRSRDPGSRRGG